ncbi:MAG TPA: hypothetical protein ENI11_01110 [Actinobacteria bacterium]|nr:hypothetical protein [Actinomycetota bacterium]
MSDLSIDESLLNSYITEMCRLSLLGVELSREKFKFLYDDIYLEHEMKRSDRFARCHGLKRYRINPALWPFLGVNNHYLVTKRKSNGLFLKEYDKYRDDSSQQNAQPDA